MKTLNNTILQGVHVWAFAFILLMLGSVWSIALGADSVVNGNPSTSAADNTSPNHGAPSATTGSAEQADPLNKKQPIDDQLYVTYDRLSLGTRSLWFTTAGLILGAMLLYLVWYKTHPPRSYIDLFADGQFVQLVVIILIVGNVCSLAVMGILGKGEVSTIYAGIVGYILGGKKPGPPQPHGGANSGGTGGNTDQKDAEGASG